MLTPDYLQALPDALVALWQQVEDDILQDVARRVGKMDGLTDTAEWQLWRLQQTRALRMDVVKLLAKYSGKSEAEIRRLLQQAGTDTLAADDAAYRAMGLQPVPVNESAVLLNLLNAGYRQTVGSWKNLTATTANTVTKQFEDALDRAWLQVSSGAFDYKTSIRQAVNELAREMKYIEYPSGHRDTLEVAVRRAVLTGVNQTGLKLQAARMDEMAQQGFENFVEVTAHTGARTDGSGGPADHAAWQGKVYHRGGRILHEGEWYEDFEAATGYGTGEGLGGWNCRHGFHPFWPGISKRNYTDEQLAAMNEANVPYNGKLYTRYEINQMQRALERKVRSAKRKYLAESEAGVDASRSAVQLKAARRQLQQFIRDTGGKADSSRTGVAGFGRSAASKATWAAKHEELRQAANEELQRLRDVGIIKIKGTLVPAPKAPDVLVFDRDHVFQRIIERHLNFLQADEIASNARFAIRQRDGAQHVYYTELGFVVIQKNGCVLSMGPLDDGGRKLMEVASKYGFGKK
ncbi:MAG: phage minor capsid protein [Faecalibacterium sp.]|nr:phage minor capsid protein [Faecalibacterium sp.]